MFRNHRLKVLTLPVVLLLIVLIAAGTLLQVRTVHAINTPWLTVSGRYIKDPGGNNVILRGVSLVDVSVADSRMRNARAQIDMATDSGSGWYARVVRLPVYPDAIDGQPGWNAGPDAYFNNHLNPAVQECVARQIYCIVDWHYIADYNTAAVDAATRAFWSYVAPKYANTPNVIFELYNEPVNPDNWSTWKTVAQPWVNLIRAAAPNNLILIGGPRWSQNVASAATSPFTGTNLVYVCHIYPQHGGQSVWDSWFGNSSSTVPYFITEWGWQNGGGTPTSGTTSSYGTPFSQYLDSKAVSWTAWVFDIYWQPIMFDLNWNILGGDNYEGQFIKDFLSRHQNDNLPGPGGATNTPSRTSTRTSTATGATATFTRTATRTATAATPTFTRTSTSTTGPSGPCSVTYNKRDDWGNGATVDVTITNTSSTTINGWKLGWNFDGNQVVSNLWNGTYTQSGKAVSVANLNYNGTLNANGGNVLIGFNMTYSGANVNPTVFTLNGVTCGGTGGPTNTPTRTPTGVTLTPTRTYTASFTPSRTSTGTQVTNTPSSTPTRTATGTQVTNTPTRTPTNTQVTNTPTRTPTASRTPTQPPPGSHLTNPFQGAKWYVNPDWAAEVNASSVSASAKSLVSQQDTAVWLDSMGSLNGTNGSRGLIGHLDAAVAQGANLIIIVVYDLPNRDCSALASNGELLISNNGAAIYKASYVDVLYNDLISKPAYANLRIIAIVEPDSLPNLVTNTGIAKCSQALGTGGYVENITYTLNKLRPLSNLYLYLDIGHSGWLGWTGNFNNAITLYTNLIKGTNAGVNGVDGFIGNVANNQVISEPYMTANQMIGGNQVRSAFFFSYNDYIDEATYDAAWKSAMQVQGLPASSTNVIIDTSRNGWGGCGGGPNVSQQCRPTGPSTSTVLETFVNQSRIDRRPAKGDWCNQNGAGIGERPTGSPSNSVYQAYVWIKPPGESDGSSSLIPVGPDNPDGKGFDQMCDPTFSGNSMNQNQNTNALPNAPVSGRWFEAQFLQLVQNAYPPIP